MDTCPSGDGVVTVAPSQAAHCASTFLYCVRPRISPGSRCTVRIGEAAAAADMTTKTLRFYEQQGLLPPVHLSLIHI